MNPLSDLPLGFGMALAQYPEAMKRFSNMSDTEKSEIISHVHNIESKEEMRSFVAKLNN